MVKRSPKALNDLPAHLVAARGALELDTLRQWCQGAEHRFVLADCSACEDKKAVLKELGRAFAFPDWYGANLDALYDCLTDLTETESRGFVVVLDHLPRGARFSADERARLLDVFRDALEPFAAAKVALRVYYS